MMFSVLPTLLYLGLYVGQSTQAQNGHLLQPHITAQPGPMVLSKNSVTIQCHGPPDAEAYIICKVESPKSSGNRKSLVSQMTNTLSISEITSDKAGKYHCSYQSGGKWSEFSDPLQLVMTGAYDKPSLLNLTSTVVASGDNVKLQCFSKFQFDAFILIKDQAHTTWNLSSTFQDREHLAIFHMDHVTSTQSGTYRCYGTFHNNPYLWSYSSDPLQLMVEAPFTETPDYPDATEPRYSTVPPHNETQKHQPFLIGFTVASALLLLLLLLLFNLWHPKAKNNATKIDRQPETAEPINGQGSEAMDPKEVTYSQVTCSVPTQETVATPSLPRQTQTSEYATLALR